MDPVCHTLTGAALGCTGLEKRSRFGRATLIIAANLPDIDAITYLTDGPGSLAIRRGVTHGLPALAVLPLLLALMMHALARIRPPPPGKPAASLSQLWLLATIGMATHPVLDSLNNYGMRWLMPFIDRWVYGDTLYIIDPLVWTILAAGVLLTYFLRTDRLSWRRHPAVISLAVTVVYIGLSMGATLAARQATFATLQENPPQGLMASPVFMRPLERRLVIEYPNEYRVGQFTLLPRPTVDIEPLPIPKGDRRDLERAAATRDGSIFIHWARFPFSEAEGVDGRRSIRVMDARYVREWEERFGAIRVEVPRNESSARPAPTGH